MKVSSSYLLTDVRNKPSKSVMVGSGRPGRFITDMGSIHGKKLFFVLWTMSLKSILSEICVVASYHMWSQKEALNCERCFASVSVARNYSHTIQNNRFTKQRSHQLSKNWDKPCNLFKILGSKSTSRSQKRHITWANRISPKLTLWLDLYYLDHRPPNFIVVIGVELHFNRFFS